MNSFKDRPVFAGRGKMSSDSVTAYLRGLNHRVFACVTRNKNSNVVCLEAVTDSSGKVMGVESYWMRAEPSYGEPWRKKYGTEREDLSEIERRLAYGVTSKLIRPGVISVKLSGVPTRTITVTSRKGRVVGTTVVAGELCILQKIHVGDFNPISMSVTHVKLTGKNRAGQTKEEVIKG